MRVLLDEDVDVRVLAWLREASHDATRVPSGLKNGAVIELSRRESRVLITRDKDFANRLLYLPSHNSGIVILRVHPPTREKLVAALRALLAQVPEREIPGKLVVVDESGYHLLS